MGVYVRPDSSFYWMLLERPNQRPLREPTGISHDAATTIGRRLQRQRADDIYRARMADLARARYDLPPEEPVTIAFDAYATWFDEHHISKRRGAERDRYALTQLKKFFGTVDLTAIDRPRVQEYITARLKKVSANTVNREVDVLKGMLREAVPKYLKASPLAGTKKLRVVPIKKRVLSAEDEARVLEQLPKRDRALYIVAVDTLIRLSNVVNLKWSEVKRTHLELEDSKTGPYTVPLSDRARAALAALPKKGTYCFPHRRTAKKDRDVRGAIRRLLERACERCDPPIPYGRANGGVTFHTATRATGATRMLRAGVDPKTVQRVGNWKSLEQMGAYLQTDDALMQAAVNTIAPITPHSRDGKLNNK